MKFIKFCTDMDWNQNRAIQTPAHVFGRTVKHIVYIIQFVAPCLIL